LADSSHHAKITLLMNLFLKIYSHLYKSKEKKIANEEMKYIMSSLIVE